MNDAAVLSLAILLPLVGAVLCALRRGTAWLALCGAAALTGCAGLLALRVADGGLVVVQAGGWPAPFGVTLLADGLSVALLLAAGVVGTAVCAARLSEDHPPVGDALVLVLLGGSAGVLLSGDLFNLYVWLEVTLVASWGLVALGGRRLQLEAALRYGVANVLASALLLAGIALLFGQTGTLNLAHLSAALPAAESPPLVRACLVFLVVALGVKTALIPVARWLTASYAAPTPTVAALIAALLTKLGAYALLRVMACAQEAGAEPVRELLLWAGSATALGGALLSVAERDLRRLVSALVISHMGMIAVGVGLLTQASVSAAVFMAAQEALTLAAMFLAVEGLQRRLGSADLSRLGDMAARTPGLAALLALPALSLAGVAPLPGFWAELVLVRACVQADRPWLVVALLVSALLALYTLLRALSRTLLAPAPPLEAPGHTAGRALPLGQLVLAAALLLLPVALGPTLAALDAASRVALTPARLRQAVLR